MDTTETPFLFVGNRLCLDFINTEIIAEGQRKDLIHNFDALKAWLQEADAVRQSEIASVTASWDALKEDSFAHQARMLRATLQQMVEQITQAQPVAEEAITAINQSLEQRKGYRLLQRTAGGYTTTFQYKQTAGGLLTPIAESAADLLARDDLTLLRKCENPQCILYFYDTSKNHTRRWCSMEACGNRYKVAAHYRRSRGETAD